MPSERYGEEGMVATNVLGPGQDTGQQKDPGGTGIPGLRMVANRPAFTIFLFLVGTILLMVVQINFPQPSQWHDIFLGLGIAILAGAVLALLESVFHADIESLVEHRRRPRQSG